MRTTVDIDETVLREAKARAARSGRTLGQLIDDALRLSFARTLKPAAGRAELPTYGRGGLLPGVDLDDSAALGDLMDGLA